jgi:hypothetical protein
LKSFFIPQQNNTILEITDNHTISLCFLIISILISVGIENFNMKHNFKIDIPTDIEKLTVDDIVFRTKDGTEELTFDEFFTELIGDIDIIQNLKNKTSDYEF